MKLEDPLIDETDVIFPTKIRIDNGKMIRETMRDMRGLDEAKYDAAVSYAECLQAAQALKKLEASAAAEDISNQEPVPCSTNSEEASPDA